MDWIKARVVFYPTLFWNMMLGRWLKIRNWWDEISPNVILGAFPFSRDVSKLAAAGVTGVVNTCEEYCGPVSEYDKYGIEQFRMPTVDYTHPEFEDVCKAVEFIESRAERDEKVYIHCKAGRARSGTVAICWLIKEQQISAVEAQRRLIEKRPHVNRHLATRPVVVRFEGEFLRKSDETFSGQAC